MHEQHPCGVDGAVVATSDPLRQLLAQPERAALHLFRATGAVVLERVGAVVTQRVDQAPFEDLERKVLGIGQTLIEVDHPH